MQIIEEVADESSSFFARIDFLDEDGNPVTPSTCHWKLTDLAGNIINGRSDVEITPLTQTYVVIPLGGADLDVLGADVTPRLISIWGTYTSQTYGAGKPYAHQVRFNIQPRVGG